MILKGPAIAHCLSDHPLSFGAFEKACRNLHGAFAESISGVRERVAPGTRLLLCPDEKVSSIPCLLKRLGSIIEFRTTNGDHAGNDTGGCPQWRDRFRVMLLKPRFSGVETSGRITELGFGV
jgi:hypothetical protein